MGTFTRVPRSKLVLIAAPLLLSLLVGMLVPLNAQTNSTWNGGSGNWSNASNWDNGVPNGNYNVYINYESTGPSTVNLDINATVDNLNLQCCDTLSISSGNTLTVQSGGSINNAGTISLAGGSIIGATGTETLFVGGSSGTAITGSGTIGMNVLLGNVPSPIVVNQGDALSITGNVDNDALVGVEVQGAGSLTIGGSLRDSGSSFVNGGTMTVMGDLVNDRDEGARLVVSNGGNLRVNGTLTNTGGGGGQLVRASGGSVVTVGGDFNNVAGNVSASFEGGSSLNVKGNLNNLFDANSVYTTLSFANGSTFSVQKDLNNSGTLTLATGSAGTASGTLNNSGSVQIDPTSVLTAKSGFNQTAGTTTVDGLLNAGGTGVSIQGGTLSGTGIVNGNVMMAGTMLPGDAPSTFTINGNYTQTSTGTLLEQVGWINGYTGSLLQVNGVANLDGTLSLSLLNGYDPTVGDSFVVMTFLQEYGSFNTITGLNLGNNEYLDLVYDPHDVRVEVESNVVSTPEPGSALLLLIGVMAVLAIYYKRVAI